MHAGHLTVCLHLRVHCVLAMPQNINWSYLQRQAPSWRRWAAIRTLLISSQRCSLAASLPLTACMQEWQISFQTLRSKGRCSLMDAAPLMCLVALDVVEFTTRYS